MEVKPDSEGMTLRQETNFLDRTVYPSNEMTIAPQDTDDTYGGAHVYMVRKCAGFENGKTVYRGGVTYINFVKKLEDGTVEPGLQNEQLYIILIDRLRKLNVKFPDIRNEQMITHLNALLDLCKARVDDRISRGVMGDLKK